MSLRLRLIIAFFLLSVVPMTAVTFIAYSTSAGALREAAEREADLLAGELGQRMQLVTAQLTERVEHVMDMAELQDAVDRATAQPQAAPTTSQSVTSVQAVTAVTSSIDEQIARSLGDAAMLLNNVDLRGLRGRGGRRPPGEPGSQAVSRGVPPDPTERTRPPRSGEPPVRPPVPPPPVGAGVDPASQAATEALRIDLAPIRRELMRELVPEGNFDALTPEQRQKLGNELQIRLLGIRQGLQLGAQALQQRADVAGQKAAGDSAEGAAAVLVSPPAPPPVAPAPPVVITSAVPVTPEPASVRRSELTGNRLDIRVERDGEVVRQLNAEVNLPNLLATVFSTTRRDRGEVPFALAKDGTLHTPTADDRAVIESFGEAVSTEGQATVRMRNWIIVTTEDPSGSGLTLGIARPVGDSLAELRRTAVTNAALGLLFIALAVVGIVPLSSRLTRNLEGLRDGVKRIAHGDYRARVTVGTRDEVGELAEAVNKMAEDVERHQRAAIEQERLKRELELGRRIQHEMLPHVPLRVGATEIKGASVPAREVGGDFFNYFQLPSGQLALLVGDVSGKGVGAALLMANIQASLRTRLALGQDLSVLADELDREIEASSPGPVYATLFVAILDPASRRLRYVNAGHNPQYVLRSDRRLEHLSASGLPIGLLAGRGYVEQSLELSAGDLLFFYTDGCVDVEDERDDLFGAERLEQLLTEFDPAGTDDVMVRVESALAAFRGSRELFDDATMMVVKVG